MKQRSKAKNSQKSPFPLKKSDLKETHSDDSAFSILSAIQQDFLSSLNQFKNQEIQNTIVFFGSAQIMSEAKSREHITLIEDKIKKDYRCTRKLQNELEQAKHAFEIASKYYTAAENLARRFTEWSMQFKNPKNQFIVCSGGGPGIMEASNKGAKLAGGKSIGLNITIPTEQIPNPYITPSLHFQFNNFLLRKFWFFYFSKAMIVFPGGIGTLDELFEILTLIKTRKITRYIPIVLYGREFWENLIHFDVMIRFGTIHKEDLELFQYADSIEETFDFITHEMESYYIEKE